MLRSWILGGMIDPDDQVQLGDGSWVPVGQVPELEMPAEEGGLAGEDGPDTIQSAPATVSDQAPPPLPPEAFLAPDTDGPEPEYAPTRVADSQELGRGLYPEPETRDDGSADTIAPTSPSTIPSAAPVAPLPEEDPGADPLRGEDDDDLLLMEPEGLVDPLTPAASMASPISPSHPPEPEPPPEQPPTRVHGRPRVDDVLDAPLDSHDPSASAAVQDALSRSLVDGEGQAAGLDAPILQTPTARSDAGGGWQADDPLLDQPIQRAGALGGSIGDEAVEAYTRQMRRSRTVGWLVCLAVVAGGVAWGLGMMGGDGEDKQATPRKKKPSATAPAEAKGQIAAAAEVVAPAHAVPTQPAPKEAISPVEEAPPKVAPAPEPEAPAKPKSEKKAAKEEKKPPKEEKTAATEQPPSPAPEGSEPEAARGVRVGGKSFDELMRLGKRARKKPSVALAYYRKALSLRPGNIEALAKVGKTYLAMGHSAKAVKMFKKCRSASSRYGPCLYWLGRAHGTAGSGGKARKAFEKYLADFPDGSMAPDARRRLGP